MRFGIEKQRKTGPIALRMAQCLLMATLASCASTPSSRQSSAHIEIHEAVGFTITEESRAGTDVREQYVEGVRLLEAGRYPEGIAMLEQVAAEAPELSAPRIDLGIAYHQTGNLEKAEQYLREALSLNAEHPIAHNELGIIYRKKGRFKEARASYEAALAVYPGYHFARRNLAVLCDLYLADKSCALENYEAYTATVPSDSEAAMWIADLENRTN